MCQLHQIYILPSTRWPRGPNRQPICLAPTLTELLPVKSLLADFQRWTTVEKRPLHQHQRHRVRREGVPSSASSALVLTEFSAPDCFWHLKLGWAIVSNCSWLGWCRNNIIIKVILPSVIQPSNFASFFSISYKNPYWTDYFLHHSNVSSLSSLSSFLDISDILTELKKLLIWFSFFEVVPLKWVQNHWD